LKTAIETMQTRRSIRTYATGSVARTTIEEIIDCARLAPTAMNDQPWEFIVITDKSALASIPKLLGHAEFIANAAFCVLVLARASSSPVEDCSAATENLLLAAAAHGRIPHPHQHRLGRHPRRIPHPAQASPRRPTPLGKVLESCCYKGFNDCHSERSEESPHFVRTATHCPVPASSSASRRSNGTRNSLPRPVAVLRQLLAAISQQEPPCSAHPSQEP